jgi:hypothetical protein
MGAFNLIGASQAGEYARKGEHPVPSIDVRPAAGIVALKILEAPIFCIQLGKGMQCRLYSMRNTVHRYRLTSP